MAPLRTAALVLWVASAGAQAQPQNYFNDPFAQISSDIANCPEPIGPRLTPAERITASHSRSERGTTCWLAGACRLPNSFRYDPEIAAAVLPRLKAHPARKGSSLWAWFWARNVFIQGCASSPAQVRALEEAARSHPDVINVITALRMGNKARAPYEVMPP